jgi:hypothetical protein
MESCSAAAREVPSRENHLLMQVSGRNKNEMNSSK